MTSLCVTRSRLTNVTGHQHKRALTRHEWWRNNEMNVYLSPVVRCGKASGEEGRGGRGKGGLGPKGEAMINEPLGRQARLRPFNGPYTYSSFYFPHQPAWLAALLIASPASPWAGRRRVGRAGDTAEYKWLTPIASDMGGKRGKGEGGNSSSSSSRLAVVRCFARQIILTMGSS